MKSRFFAIITFILAITLAGCAQNSVHSPANLERTWNEGVVYAPGKASPRAIKRFETDRPYPVVLYFHGCTGISTINDIPWAKLLASNGFLVVMPDSFKRVGKYAECDPKTLRRPSVADGYLRVDEILFALEQLKQTNWSDGRVYLMGHSQAAWALTRVPIHDVTGIVLSSLMSCPWGINIPRSVPVLRIGYANDPWNQVSPLKCDAHLVHENFQMKIIDGAEHETYYSPRFRQDVLDFLRTTK
jgi:dienelactone hydrolase